MEEKPKLIAPIISAVLLFPTMINAIRKSIFLIINGFGPNTYQNPFINSAYVISFNMILAIVIMMYSIIYIVLLSKNYPQIKQIHLQKQIALILYSLISVIIIWMISKISNPNEQLMNSVSLSWIISLIASIVVLIYDWIRK